MTPKELQFMFDLLEHAAEGAYKLGHADGAEGKPLKTEGFTPNKATRLTIKTNLTKLTQKR